MLGQPDLPDVRLTTLLREAYGLDVSQFSFLPLGADSNTAVYEVLTSDGQAYFVKLRRGVFGDMSVRLPHYLKGRGVPHLIPVIATTDGDLWAGLEPYTVTVYPFVRGKNGYEAPLTAVHWRAFGAALRQLHTLELPPELQSRLRRETYDAGAREQVKAFLASLDTDQLEEPIAKRLFALMREHRAGVADLVDRAERYADILKVRTPKFTLCHSDLHAGNVLVDENGFYLVDWDDPVLAPRESDLMFIGGAQGFVGTTPGEEERLFYSGYGQVDVDPVALAYYRLERIVQDVAIYCNDIVRGVGSKAEREQSLRYLTANFRPEGTITRAYAAAAGPSA